MKDCLYVYFAYFEAQYPWEGLKIISDQPIHTKTYKTHKYLLLVVARHTGDSVPGMDTSILTGVAQLFWLPDGQMRQLFVISIFIQVFSKKYVVTLPSSQLSRSQARGLSYRFFPAESLLTGDVYSYSTR